MEYPKGFANLEEMIEKYSGVMSICDFDQLLQQLERIPKLFTIRHSHNERTSFEYR